LDASSEDVIEYEVYHVRRLLHSASSVSSPSSRPLGIHMDSENTIGRCNCLFSSTSKVVPTFKKTKRHGNLYSC
jgi:hypothetical protein